MFVGPDGDVVPSLTESEMREVDRVAIEETGPNLFQMMENAGRGLAVIALEMLDDLGDGPVVVLAGTGGNGGGGITAGRHLANRDVDVLVTVTDPTSLGEVPAFQLRVFDATQGKVVGLDDLDGVTPVLITDAVVGYSPHGAPRGAAEEMIEWANTQATDVLSLDVPSGVDATSGVTPGVFVTPDRTLTLALPKTGLGDAATGSIVLADLGIPLEAFRRAGVPLDRSPFDKRFLIPLHRA